MSSEQDRLRDQDALLGKRPHSLERAFVHRTRGKTFRHPRPSDSGRVQPDLVEEFGKLTGIDSTDAPSAKSLKGAFEALPPKAQKAALNHLRSKTQNFEALYATMLGLPSRIRSFVKKIWKRQDKWGDSWEKVASEMAAGAAKILSQRIDVTVYTPFAVTSGEVDRDDPRLERMATAQAECDALLCLFAHYFIIGVTGHIAMHCMSYRIDDPATAGVVDVADYGSFDASARRHRQLKVLEAAKKYGWEIPERSDK